MGTYEMGAREPIDESYRLTNNDWEADNSDHNAVLADEGGTDIPDELPSEDPVYDIPAHPLSRRPLDPGENFDTDPPPSSGASAQEKRNFELWRSRRMIREYHQRELAMAEGGDVIWPNNSRCLERGDNSFSEWFAPVLPDQRGMKEYTETTLDPLSTRLGLEVGGPGSNLFSGFTPEFFDETVGVNLTDTRLTSPYRQSIIDTDNSRNHSVITGDMLDPLTHQKVLDWLGDRKVSFLAERLFAGENCLPSEPFLLGRQAQFWYKILAEGGVMFAQVPRGLNGVIDAWHGEINANHPALEVQIGKHLGRRVLRLFKQPGAPETLPLLDARTATRLIRGYPT